MKRLAYLFLAWLALWLVLPFVIVFGVAASHRDVVLDPIERDHIRVASQFVRAFAAEHARFPDGEAFGEWIRTMDERGYAYGGNGLYLDTTCARTGKDFCLGFWHGDLWVTYRSDQSDQNAASIDGRVFDTLFNAVVSIFLLAVAAGFFVLARRAKLKPPL
ncbi:hypothetical protein J2W30_001853 [Variovorax boronicumulans]|uniref:hypothetical protein n=1 Tax=Variovorax TaxID=34072 RepID=UPI002782E3BD|nr:MULTISPECIES: hypothetical protein [Variovorax]MDQ0034098.1 hypothetical protein [Variovorax boronicumulans]MDQ0612097.1 hypothetical protein [Variovorax sp. W1I1]